MNTLLENFFKRRSVRVFNDKPISDDVLKSILESAMAAPSAANKQPWEFVVIQDIETRKRVSEVLPYGKFLTQAPLGIVVCGKEKEAYNSNSQYMIMDCSAAIENILLSATQFDIGSCWVAIYPEKDRVFGVRDVCKIPVDVTPIGLVVLGYSDQKPGPRTQYKQTKVHIEKW